MLKSTSFRTLVFLGKKLITVMFYTWIKLMLVYLLLIKDCYEILLLLSCRLKGFMWIVKELCVDSLWRDLLEEMQSHTFQPMIFQSNKYDVYMCYGCRNLNKSILPAKNFNLKTPLRKSLSDSVNVRESMDFNQLSSFRVLNIRRVDESSETRNASCKDKTFASVCCQCEPSNILNNRTFPKCYNEQDCSKNINKVGLNERRNMFREASTSPLNCQYETPESVKLVNKISNVDGSRIGTRTPLNSPDTLVTPAKELNILPRRCRLELMSSNEDHLSEVSTENESLFRRNWNKLKRFSKIDKINFTRRNNGVNEPTDQTATQIETSNSDTLEGRNILITLQTPEMNSCCGNVFCRFKTKFNQNVKESSVTYKRF